MQLLFEMARTGSAAGSFLLRASVCSRSGTRNKPFFTGYFVKMAGYNKITSEITGYSLKNCLFEAIAA